MKLFEVYPINDINIVKGLGSALWDDNGVQYLDMYGGHAVISIGHSNPHYVSLLTDQLNKIGFYSNSIRIPLQCRLADLLGQLSGKRDYQLFLCNSGAEANENALKLGSFDNGKRLTVAFSGSFHGRTSLAVAATDNKSIVAPINETSNVVYSPFNDIEALRELFEERGDDISSVIFEAIQGVGGIRVASKEFIVEIRRLCDKYNAVMIADEVQCGCGRSGSYFACDFGGVDADIYSMAKGIGNGFPIGAIMISPRFKANYGMLGTTFGGNHLACVAAIAVAEEMINNNLIQHATNIGSKLMTELSQIDGIEEIRGRGLMIGFDLAEDSTEFRKNLLNRDKIFVGSASNKKVVRLLPALNISESACTQTVMSITKNLKKM